MSTRAGFIESQKIRAPTVALERLLADDGILHHYQHLDLSKGNIKHGAITSA
jgi:hypothetical protein